MDIVPLLFLFAVALAASTLSSIAGFGGSLLVLPVLVHIAGPLGAVPAFTIAGLMSNGARAALGRAEIHRRVLLAFVVGAVPGAALGSIVFVSLPPEWAQRALSIFIIAMMFVHRSGERAPWPSWVIAVAGAGSAFLSGVFGFSGPVSSAIFFAQGLSPASYIASEAASAMVVHGVKVLAYGRLNALTLSTLWIGISTGAVMAAGAWVGRRLIGTIPVDRYRWGVRALFVLAALSLLLPQ